MKDVLKPCARCNHDHHWGVLAIDKQGVRLYGARPCTKCDCVDFENAENKLPAGWTQKEAEELWSKTSFLNSQASLQTRVWVSNIMALGKGDDTRKTLLSRLFGRNDGSLMEKQWPEFMGLMLSQVTDIRGTLVGSEAKFGNLVAHTDEIVSGMQGVVQLSERLAVMRSSLGETERRLDKLETLLKAVADKLGVETEEPAELEEVSRQIFHDSAVAEEDVDVSDDHKTST